MSVDDSSYSAGNRNEQFEGRLRALCEEPLGEDALNMSVQFFTDLYQSHDEVESAKDFRHSYSMILRIMHGGSPPANAQDMARCIQRSEMLSANLDQIGEMLDNSSCPQRVSDCFMKLQDHVNLEAQRMTVFQSSYDRIADASEAFEQSLTKQENRLEDIKTKQVGVEEELNHVRNQHIAILGIFAAVVLVFNGAIGFSTSAVEVAGFSPSIANLVFIVAVVGLVLVNTVALLLGFIWCMTRSGSAIPSFAWVSLIVLDLVLIGLLIVTLCNPGVFPETIRFANVQLT